MNEQNLYRELLAWLRSNHPLIFSEWERQRKKLEGRQDSEKRLLQSPGGRSRSGLDQLASDAGMSSIIRAMQVELESLGISGGTPGVTQDGTPCIHLLKEGVYGSAYEESVTMARLRDPGYRRHLRQVFG